MSDSGLVTLRDVAVSFDDERTVSFDNLTFGAGERVAVLGRNGSGKSTLCSLIAGLSRPSQGRIVRTPAFRRLSIGYLPQAGGLCRELTVFENIDLQRRLYGLRGSFDPRLFHGLWDLGLESEVNTPVGALSGGFARLTALAAVLAAETPVLILDEPFSGLDDERRAAAGRALSSAAETRQLVVMTAHEASEIPFTNRQVVVGAANA